MKVVCKILQRTLFVFFAGSFLPVQAVHLNEWTFETEPSGLTLSQAANTGTEGAVFEAGGEGFVETDGLGGLLCTNKDAGAAGLWAEGAVLDAPLSSYSSGVYYLRYDVEYDFRSANNNSGTMLGVYFTDSLGNKAAGFSLVYDKGNLTNAVPAERQLIPVPGAAHLLKYGSLTAIAEVDLSGQTAKVWYSLNGTAPTNYSTPSFSTNIALTSIDNLRFHATGDFQPDGSSENPSLTRSP